MRWLGLVALSAVLLTVVATGSAAHGDTTRISLSSGPANTQGNDSSVDASMSGNGNLVVFKSNATNLVANDTNGSVADIYVRDRAAGTTSLVSVDTSGNQFTSPSEEPAISYDGTVVTWVAGGEIYVRTLPSGPTKLASRTPGGAARRRRQPRAGAERGRESHRVLVDREQHQRSRPVVHLRGLRLQPDDEPRRA